MTSTKKLSVTLDGQMIPLEATADDFGELVRLYAANPLYRAATFGDRVIEDDPYRRPVRPDDLEWVDYSTPINRDNAQELSSLIGQRILLNVFDTRKTLLPKDFTEERREEHELFYAERNLLIGEAVRPYLERHLYGFVEAEAAERVGDLTAAGLYARLNDLQEARRASAARLGALVSGSPDARRASTTIAIQLLGQALNGPARVLPGGSEVLGGTPMRMPAVGTDDLAENALREFFAAAELRTEPHAYYQFYLPSTMGLMNYLNANAHNAGRAYRYLGALCAHGINTRAQLGRLAEFAVGVGGVSTLADRAAAGGPLPAGTRELVAAAVDRWGGFAAAELSRGLEEYAILLDVHDEDVLAQLTWVDSAPACKEKAERLQRGIVENNVEVDLDTFVESWEECSTTHVHDEDRLLIIETGEMEFYNSFEGTHRFYPGDKMFIPKHRLHGSVVLSGECVYHQPVITPELAARLG